ncbi:MAG TPA: multiheme c-type cytochrome [Steroidobacteraceae bacterium]|jgi:hypothetical protein|nr:multiheme c-type cytochrome [Steroidobacteraceae bacterium]
MMRAYSILCCALFFAVPPWTLARAADTPPATAGAYKHLGVASCATSVCHGKETEQTGRDVALNEYRIWLEQDRHSQAYRALDNARSRQIAANLGLPSATTAKLCLDCHADNVPATQRGPKFQISDGVQCEACHGGSEKWIETHSQQSVTHAANVANGLNPTEQPLRRAQVCLSCHEGTADQFTTHRIMGAGHPRLAFELDTYTYNQPRHFKADTPSYVKRKGKIPETNLWITGQLQTTQRYLTLVQSPLFTPGGLTPELSMFDCFACHHSIDKPHWTRAHAGNGIPPGTLRLQRQYFLVLQAITETLEPKLTQELVAATDTLMQAGQTDAGKARAAAKALQDWVRARDEWSKRSYSANDTAALRKALLRFAAEDRASDFAMAEQVVLGVESLSYSLGDHERRKSAIDALYNGVASAAKFDPAQFMQIARGLQGQF